jgi:hypothetical protein
MNSQLERFCRLFLRAHNFLLTLLSYGATQEMLTGAELIFILIYS